MAIRGLAAILAPMENRIREWRKRRGLTQKELADKAGSHWTSISRLENEHMQIDEKWLLAISTALEVSPADLLSDEPVTVHNFAGMSEEAAPYQPPPGHHLSGMKLPLNQELYEIKSDALNAIGINSGDLAIIDMNADVVAALKAGKKKVANVLIRAQSDPDDPAQAVSLPRQYIWPSTVIRNSLDRKAAPLDLELDDIDIAAEIASVIKPGG